MSSKSNSSLKNKKEMHTVDDKVHDTKRSGSKDKERKGSDHHSDHSKGEHLHHPSHAATSSSKTKIDEEQKSGHPTHKVEEVKGSSHHEKDGHQSKNETGHHQPHDAHHQPHDAHTAHHQSHINTDGGKEPQKVGKSGHNSSSNSVHHKEHKEEMGKSKSHHQHNDGAHPQDNGHPHHKDDHASLDAGHHVHFKEGTALVPTSENATGDHAAKSHEDPAHLHKNPSPSKYSAKSSKEGKDKPASRSQSKTRENQEAPKSHVKPHQEPHHNGQESKTSAQ